MPQQRDDHVTILFAQGLKWPTFIAITIPPIGEKEWILKVVSGINNREMFVDHFVTGSYQGRLQKTFQLVSLNVPIDH